MAGKYIKVTSSQKLGGSTSILPAHKNKAFYLSQNAKKQKYPEEHYKVEDIEDSEAHEAGVFTADDLAAKEKTERAAKRGSKNIKTAKADTGNTDRIAELEKQLEEAKTKNQELQLEKEIKDEEIAKLNADKATDETD